MATNIYIDADKADDTGNGNSWATAKKTLQAGVDLVTAVVTDETTIHLKKGTASPYTGDVLINGIHTLGKDAKFILQVEDFNYSNYESGIFDPYNPTNGQGTWDNTASKPIVMNLTIEIRDSTGAELYGFSFVDAGDGAGIKVEGQSNFKARYCRFEGAGAIAMLLMESCGFIENSHFLRNRLGALSAFKSFLVLMGDTSFEDPLFEGALATVNSTISVQAWDLHPLEKYTLEVKTTSPRMKRFAALHASIGSTIQVQSRIADLFTESLQVAHVHVRNEYRSLHPEQYGVLLETGSLLVGAENMTYTTLNEKGEAVPMPKDQTVVVTEDDNTMFRA